MWGRVYFQISEREHREPGIESMTRMAAENSPACSQEGQNMARITGYPGHWLNRCRAELKVSTEKADVTDNTG
jgi:hypothetical protein